MIKIDKDYGIAADGDRSYMLVKGEAKTTIGKDGRSRASYNTLGYFSRLSSLLQAYLDLKLKQRIDTGSLQTLKELMNEIKAQKIVLKELLSTEIK